MLFSFAMLSRSLVSRSISVLVQHFVFFNAADSKNKTWQCMCPAPIINTGKPHPSLISTISWKELNEVTRNFSNDVLIGQGTHSKCFLGVLKDGQNLALKQFSTSEEIQVQVPIILRTCYHENIVQFCGYFLQEGTHVLAYEYAPRGSLHDILHGKTGVEGAQPGPPLSWLQRVKIAISAAKGLEFLHKVDPPVIHSNIKSSNIFLFDNDVAKIGDIGILIAPNKRPYISERMENYKTVWPFRKSDWQAPECTSFGPYSTKSNVYSFGIVLLELLTGHKVIDYIMPHGQLRLVAWATPRLGEDKVEQYIDPRLGGEYPRKAVSKMAAVAALCLQDKLESRPEMNIVVNALSLLLNSK